MFWGQINCFSCVFVKKIVPLHAQNNKKFIHHENKKIHPASNQFAFY